MRLFVSISLAIAVVAVAAAGVQGRPTHVGCAGKDIHFTAADKSKLVAHRWGTGKTFVVLAHQDYSNLCEWNSYGKRLAKLGYSALAFDFVNLGESQYRPNRPKARIPVDVTAAVKLARSLGAQKVFLVGNSMGGWAVLVAATATKPPVQGVVSVSTVAQYLGDVMPFVSKLTVPVLYIAAKGEATDTLDAQQMYAATPGEKSLTLVGGKLHGIQVVDRSPTARTAIERFLRAH